MGDGHKPSSHKSYLHLAMLTSIITAAALTTSVAGQDTQDPLADDAPPGITFCDDGRERAIGRRLLYVSTLDGQLSALDITKGGKLRWSIPTGPGPLISSSIHRLELTNNGQFVRMIPSLSGGIYKFDGEYIDPIPITTDNLLSSSTKFSDDLVISGGKETRTYGVCARTGQLLYECSMHGCVNSTDGGKGNETSVNNVKTEDSVERGAGDNYLQAHDPLLDDVVVVRRITQTVRAVESRTGVERWNFSVGQHELNIVRAPECHERPYSDMDMAILDLDVKVIVPEGVICAFSKSQPNVMLWKYKFDHPIVSSWKLSETDDLEPIDLFGTARWLWDQDENIFESPLPTSSPSIYLGMYDRQLYIQESVNLRREISDQSNLYNELVSESHLPKIPWRPFAASSNALVIFSDDKVISGNSLLGAQASEIHSNELVPYDEDNFAVSAQSVLNASEYVNGNGFYLYTQDELKKTNQALCDKPPLKAIEGEKAKNTTNHTITDDLGFSLDDIDAPVKVVILSLWFWWKEIVVIAFTSAILLNILLGQRQHTEREIVVIERHIPVPTAMEATESSTAALLGPTNTSSSKSISNNFSQRTLSESTTHSGELFSSRFQGDFDLVRCLGRGGFGVVFETKNKLDDCKYAVKRITLPNKKESRDRVMREVKTLANCEHQNIVRYFQAWVETPPPGWQEEEDSKWLAHEMSTSIQIETPDGTTLPSFANSGVDLNAGKGKLQLEKKQQLLSWVSSVASTACSSDHEDNDCIQELAEDEDEDSCIVFRTESQSLALQDDEGSSTDSIPNKDDSYETKTTVEHRQKNDFINIDIHSNSIDIGPKKNGNNHIDYSQLSNSFQIEFVRPAGEYPSNRSEFSELNTEGRDAQGLLRNGINKSRSRPISLELVENGHNKNNNCTALVPTQASPLLPIIKPVQNKVYLYIQMQLCRKESLRDWLRENKTETRRNHIANIFHQIVDAVDYVHFKGLIHRDLKPSNIFFSQDGQIKIGDFGLVTDMSDIPNLVTKCGDKTGLPSCARHTQQVGTHLYMSPEQLRGLHYDYKVDIYSLGLIFFELLVYFNTEMERIITLRDLRDGRYPKHFSDNHPDEYGLLQKMLAADPTVRPATLDLKAQLNTILKLPEVVGDQEPIGRRLSSSRTYSCSE